jgi:hypothetical protein
MAAEVEKYTEGQAQMPRGSQIDAPASSPAVNHNPLDEGEMAQEETEKVETDISRMVM